MPTITLYHICFTVPTLTVFLIVLATLYQKRKILKHMSETSEDKTYNIRYTKFCDEYGWLFDNGGSDMIPVLFSILIPPVGIIILFLICSYKIIGFLVSKTL